MDDQFDALSKALATGVSRRRALKLVGGTLAGGLLAALGRGEALADECKRNGKKCKKNSQCCSGICEGGTCAACRADGGSCTANSQCCSGNCANGTCAPACRADGGSCTQASDCCSTLCDTTTNTCVSCIPTGNTGCRQNSDCCEFGPLYGCVPGGLCVYSCFTAGTGIALADGTSRPIEQVRVGDLVLGRDGRANRVVGNEQHLLGTRHLYALNDHGFFVTPDHPFLTTNGWKAGAPNTAAAKLGLQVGQLTVGDRLLRLAHVAVPVGAGGVFGTDDEIEVELDTVVLQHLAHRPADPLTPVYNLRLAGDEAYFANDLLVHSHYV